MKLMELARAKERQKQERLSRPNHETVAVPSTALKPKKRKRKRPLRTTGVKSGNGARYYSSSDDDEDQPGNGLDMNNAGFDTDLATYKKLLSALEVGSTGMGRTRFSVGGVDEDVAVAVHARRMQKEGRDGEFLSGDNSDSVCANGSGDEDSDADSEEESEESGGDTLEHISETGVGEMTNIMERHVDEDGPASNGSAHPEEHGQEQEQEGSEEEADITAVAEAGDLGVDEEEHRGSGRAAGSGRCVDQFNRHFISTPVFPPDEATAMLSTSGRPIFKSVAKTDELWKWEAAGLSISASKNVGEVPSALAPGASVSRDLGVLPSLAEGWEACNSESSSSSSSPSSAEKLQALILPPMVGYRDMMYCAWRDEDAAAVRRSYALHALNHALTSQRRVLRHTVKLRKAAEEAGMAEALVRDSSSNSNKPKKKKSSAKAAAALAEGTESRNGTIRDSRKEQEQNGYLFPRGETTATEAEPAQAPQAAGKIAIDGENSNDEWQRDQGFTRPKVLVLLPFRALAHELVDIMVGLLGTKTVVINQDRFDEEYGPDDDDDDLGLEEGHGDKGKEKMERAKAVIGRKPPDWKALMGEGRNVDDMFTIGLSISPGGGKGKPGEGKGVALRLYCDFYNSDIVIASPVAMHRAAVPTPGEDGEGANDTVDGDFLSSVEVCIMDRADVFLMQNWAYVPEIAEVLNARPSGERASRVDFSRVRHAFLHDQGKLFRQTLVFSAFQVCGGWSVSLDTNISRG